MFFVPFLQTSPTPSQESLDGEGKGDLGDGAVASFPISKTVDPNAPFCPTSFCTYAAHTAVVLDLNWSKVNYPKQLSLFSLKYIFDKFVQFVCRTTSCCLAPWIEPCVCGTSPEPSAFVVSNTWKSSRPSAFIQESVTSSMINTRFFFK